MNNTPPPWAGKKLIVNVPDTIIKMVAIGGLEGLIAGSGITIPKPFDDASYWCNIVILLCNERVSKGQM